MESKKFSRREMLKFLGAGSAAAILAGCQGVPAQPGASTTQQEQPAAAADTAKSEAPPADQIKMSVATFARRPP